MMTMRLGRALAAVALLAHGADALRSHVLLASPRQLHIVSARGTRATLGHAQTSAAVMRMQAVGAGQDEQPVRAVGRRQRFKTWLKRKFCLVLVSIALLRALAFSSGGGAAHAGVVAGPVAEHKLNKRYSSGAQAPAPAGAAGRALSVPDASVRRSERRNPELASATAAPAPARSAGARGAVGVEIPKAGFAALAARLAEAFAGVAEMLPPGTADAMVLLAATAFIVPILATFKLSPILGFLIAGCALGPNGFHLVRDVHTTEVLAELGVVFFLFEMGLELSFERLKALSRDAFGLGSFQFILTTLALAVGGEFVLGLPRAASLVVGASLALSSSAFVIQLLQERQELATRFGRASFGILLFQDIAVVPMLVLVPLLGTGGTGAALGPTLLMATGKALAALSIIGGLGPIVLRRAYQGVTASKSQEAFVAITLFTVLSMSTFTKALGLSDTLGAFLAGVLLAESKYRYQIEADIAPFRGILFGLFFITIGYAIDLRLLAANWGRLSVMLVLLHLLKAGLLVLLCKVAGLTTKAGIRTGVLLSQAGEFAFVLFGLAQQHGVIDAQLAKLLLLLAALSMSATPFLADAGAAIADGWERRQKRLVTDEGVSVGGAPVLEPSMDHHNGGEGQVLVCGYGGVGTVVCDLLATMFVPYAACDIDPAVVAAAQERGLPVYFGDARRPDVLRAFGLLKSAKAVVIAMDKPSDCLRITKSLRRDYPDLPIFVRSTAASRKALLDVGAQSVVSGEMESALLIGAAVLKCTGKNEQEVISLIDDERSKLYAQSMKETLANVPVYGAKEKEKEKEEVVDVDIVWEKLPGTEQAEVPPEAGGAPAAAAPAS